MSTWREIAEIFFAATPALLCAALLVQKASNQRVWFLRVVGSAFLTVISLGLLLSRLVSNCPTAAPSCPDGLAPRARSPGLFTECFSCTSPTQTDGLSTFLNSITFSIQLGSTVVTVIMSLIVMIQFMIWAKRTLKDSY
jgi:hypothetical protein